MVTIIVIFIIAIIAFVPICFTSIGASTWSNSMAWRIMDDIDPYQSSDARMIKQEISDWLDLKPREKKYDEEYSRGCDSTWRQLFNLEFCEWDFQENVQPFEDTGELEDWCSTHNCNPTPRLLDCDKYEQMFKEMYAKKHGLSPDDPNIPSSCEAGDYDPEYEINYDCMNGAWLDCNNNGHYDESDNVLMTTCYDGNDARIGGDCGSCSYVLPGQEINGRISNGHKQIDLTCVGGSSGHRVFTPMSGMVVYSSMTNNGWGYERIIYSCGTLTHFNHLHFYKMTDDAARAEAGLPELGDWVNAGDAIGFLGGGVGVKGSTEWYRMNGDSSGTHLDVGTSYCNKGKGSATAFDVSKSGFVNPGWGENSGASNAVCDNIYSRHNTQISGVNQWCSD